MRLIAVAVLLVAGHGALTAQNAARHSVVGMVAQESGVPIPEAEIWFVVSDTRASVVRSDSTGHFLIAAEVTGPSRLMVRRLGYLARQVPLEFPRDTLNALLIMLEATPLTLQPIEVYADGDELGGWLHEFNERRRANRFGRFMTREDIKRANKPLASELLRNVPGTTLTAGRRPGNITRFRGCTMPPMIWIDGVRVPYAEFDDMARPDDIAGLEVYTSTAGVPAQYTDRTNSGCGTIVIWTRHR